MTFDAWKSWRFAQVRDATLLILGVLGIVWSTLAEDTDRPALLAVFVACVGLAPFLSLARKD